MKLDIYRQYFLGDLTVNALIKNSSAFKEAVSVRARQGAIHECNIALAFASHSNIFISKNAKVSNIGSTEKLTGRFWVEPIPKKSPRSRQKAKSIVYFSLL